MKKRKPASKKGQFEVLQKVVSTSLQKKLRGNDWTYTESCLTQTCADQCPATYTCGPGWTCG